MDGYLFANLTTACRVIKKDWDMMFLVDGGERAGKSTLAIQCAVMCDPTFKIDRVVFTPNAFRSAIMSAEKYQAVVYDEAFTGLNSRAAMTLVNRTLVSMLAEIGQKNLFVFVVMPTFFDLDKYAALWRSRALLHVYTGDDFERGFFAFYNVDKKKELYILGKKFYSYLMPKPNFIGRFTSFFPIDEAAYRQKKRDSLMNREKNTEDVIRKHELELELFERVMNLPDSVSHTIKMAMLAMPQATYFRKLKIWREQNDLNKI